jgi:hypothetical protein
MNTTGLLIALALVIALVVAITFVLLARGRAARRDPGLAAERLHRRRQGGEPGAPTAGFGNYDKGAGV